MNGIKYLLDTNFILGVLKSNPLVLEELSIRKPLVVECSYSAITRMELLGFHGITKEEETLILQKLKPLTYIPLTIDIEDRAIELRKSRKIKLPDAIIAATAMVFRMELLTLDQDLLTIVGSDNKPG